MARLRSVTVWLDLHPLDEERYRANAIAAAREGHAGANPPRGIGTEQEQPHRAGCRSRPNRTGSRPAWPGSLFCCGALPTTPSELPPMPSARSLI